MNTQILYANIGLLFLQKEELKADNAALQQQVSMLQAEVAALKPTAAPATDSASEVAQA